MSNLNNIGIIPKNSPLDMIMKLAIFYDKFAIESLANDKNQEHEFYDIFIDM